MSEKVIPLVSRRPKPRNRPISAELFENHGDELATFTLRPDGGSL
jgi:hypothetical protein